ncbi:MAG: 50S ribosomal protein L17 [candidate division WWE3 bacterium]|nr:50S ribosomal protein L17 [candidate division WWE3 bacterium]
MRHRVKRVKFNRDRDHRNSLLRNLVRSLFLEDGITTTEAKAKWLRSHADHLVTIAKIGGLTALRRLITETGNKDLAKKIIDTSAKLTARNSGYLSLTKVGIRVGDKAPMVKVDFIYDVVEKEKVVKEDMKVKKTIVKTAPKKAKVTENKSEVVEEVAEVKAE